MQRQDLSQGGAFEGLGLYRVKRGRIYTPLGGVMTPGVWSLGVWSLARRGLPIVD